MNPRILLVDDHPMLRNGLRQAITQEAGLTLAGEAPTGALALQLAGELKPDLIVMDLHLADMNGIEATRQILGRLPATKVIIFTSDSTRALVDQALQAGACGYVLKTGDVKELIQAIDLVMKGGLYLSPELSTVILEDYRKVLLGEAEPAKPLLSELEKRLLRLVAEGRRNKEIAVELATSTKSVEAHRSRLMKKLGCASSAEMVRYAVREGIAVL